HAAGGLGRTAGGGEEGGPPKPAPESPLNPAGRGGVPRRHKERVNGWHAFLDVARARNIHSCRHGRWLSRASKCACALGGGRRRCRLRSGGPALSVPGGTGAVRPGRSATAWPAGGGVVGIGVDLGDVG